MSFYQKIKLFICLFIGLGSVAVAQQASDPFYRYGFPQDNIFISLDKALKKPKTVHKLKLHDVDLNPKLNKLGKFNELVVLELKNNKIDSLPLKLYNNPALRYLSIKNNSLKLLHEGLGRMDRLEVLKLHEVRLDSFPNSFKKLVSLQQLEIQSNRADTLRLDSSFSALTRLNSLLFYRTVLNQFPPAMATRSLENAYFIHTELSSVDSVLYENKKLKILVLEGNKLTSIPKDILKLQKLEMLSFKNNHLKKLPEFISKLPNLKTIDLTGNPIPKYQVHILKILMPHCRILH